MSDVMWIHKMLHNKSITTLDTAGINEMLELSKYKTSRYDLKGVELT